MAGDSVCSHSLIYALSSQAERCEFIRANCGDQFDTINFGVLAYCHLKEQYWLIVPIYVRRGR